MGEIVGKVLGVMAFIALGILIFVNANKDIGKKTTDIVPDFDGPTIEQYQGK